MKKENDDHQMELFLEDKTFTETMRKARRRAIQKNTLITAVILILLCIAVVLGSTRWLNGKIAKEDNAESQWLYITKPNIQQNGTVYDWNLFSVRSQQEYSKIVGERTIPWNSVSKYYGLFGSGSASSGWMESYNTERKGWEVFNRQNGQRELVFYHPRVHYDQFPDDLQILNGIESDKYVEFSLSFDQPYCYSDVQHLLDPKDTEWLWIDTASDEDIKRKNQKAAKGEMSEIFLPGDIFGYPYSETTGWESPEVLIRALQSPELYGDYADSAKDVLIKMKEDNPELDPQKVKIIGAVVTGTPEKLKKYQNQSFIRASSLGASTDKY